MPSRGERAERTVVERLEDMLEAIGRISTYTSGMDVTAFVDSQITVDAVIRNLEVIGEAARHIPERLQHHYHRAPWRWIIGMRNRLAHDYPHTDLPLIWETVQIDLPELQTALRRMLHDARAEGGRAP